MPKNTFRGLLSIGSGWFGVRNEIMPPGSAQSSIEGSDVSLPRYFAAIWSAVIPTPVFGSRLRGLTQFSHVSSMMPCGLELSPPLLRRPLTTVTCSRMGSRGLRMNGKSKSRPIFVGVPFVLERAVGEVDEAQSRTGRGDRLRERRSRRDHRIQQRERDGRAGSLEDFTPRQNFRVRNMTSTSLESSSGLG